MLVQLKIGSTGSAFAYARTSQGQLLVSADPGRAWRTIEGIGTVLGMTIDEEGTAHVLSTREDRWQWWRSDEAGQWEAKPLPDAPFRGFREPTCCTAVLDSTWVVAGRDGTLVASTDAGETWNETRLPSQVRAVTVARLAGGPRVVGALYLESEDRSYLFSWLPGSKPELVADLSPDVAVGESAVDSSEGIGRAHDVLWDAMSGSVWVAGTFGLCAFRPVLPA